MEGTEWVCQVVTTILQLIIYKIYVQSVIYKVGAQNKQHYWINTSDVFDDRISSSLSHVL